MGDVREKRDSKREGGKRIKEREEKERGGVKDV